MSTFLRLLPWICFFRIPLSAFVLARYLCGDPNRLIATPGLNRPYNNIMGIYDRDYQRSSEPGLHLSAPQSMTMKIVVFTGCVYLVQVVFGPASWLNRYLDLDPDWYTKPWQFYQLLSYGFLHSTFAFQHILFNMFLLWLFGREIEQRYGRREFLGFYLSAIVLAGLVWNLSTVMSGSPSGGLIGASGGSVAVLILFAFNFPHRTILFMFLFPMPMWILGCIIVFMDASGAMGYQGMSNVAFIAHLGGAAYAYVYFRYRWNPVRWIIDKYSSLSSSRPRTKTKLRIHDPEDDVDTEMIDEVDEILMKIKSQGQDSLTRRERKILEQASQEYQRRRK